MHHDDIHPILKYPRTPHLEGSRLQPGDSAADQARCSLAGRHVVIEEKLDGANAGLSFSGAADLLLQSRGHYLTGGGRERQFNLFKQWAAAHEARLLHALEDRYVMYGEWTYSKHSVFYDCLPHHFHEFDVYDRREGVFLSTPRRHALLGGSPVLSVPVLYAGPMPAPRKMERGRRAKKNRGEVLTPRLCRPFWTAARIMAAPSCRTGWRRAWISMPSALRDLGIAGAAHDVRAGRAGSRLSRPGKMRMENRELPGAQRTPAEQAKPPQEPAITARAMCGRIPAWWSTPCCNRPTIWRRRRTSAACCSSPRCCTTWPSIAPPWWIR